MSVLPPLPFTDDPDTAPFWQGSRAGKLLVQSCDDCARLRFPPHPFCAACRSPRVSWVEMSGRGRLWSYAIAHKPVLPAFDDVVPFPFIVVELEEDPRLRLPGNILAAEGAPINSLDPSRLVIGMQLRVTFDRITDEVTLPRWVPAATSTDTRA